MQNFDKMTDDELQTFIDKGQRQLSTGFVSGPSAAPDKIAVRQEYNKAGDDLKAQRKRLQSFAPTLPRIERFGSLNRQQETGGLQHKIPFIKDQGGLGFLGGQDTELGEMNSISKGLQVGSVPPGQGAVSNFERELMAGNTPNIKNNGNVNANIRQTLLSAYQQDNDSLAFQEAYLNANGHLNGATEAWGKYVAQHAYTVETTTDKGDSRLVPNPKRQDWRQYFGVSGPAQPASATRPPPTTPPQGKTPPVKPATNARPGAASGAVRPATKPATARPSLDSIWGQ